MSLIKSGIINLGIVAIPYISLGILAISYFIGNDYGYNNGRKHTTNEFNARIQTIDSVLVANYQRTYEQLTEILETPWIRKGLSQEAIGAIDSVRIGLDGKIKGVKDFSESFR